MRLAVLAAAILLAACADNPVDPPTVPLAGGYAPASASDSDVMAAEKVALDEIYRREPQRSLVENVTREQQVVAGMNYRFNVTMSNRVTYRVVVYKPLDGAMSVTGFEILAGG
jgi:hypothetical protein